MQPPSHTSNNRTRKTSSPLSTTWWTLMPHPSAPSHGTRHTLWGHLSISRDNNPTKKHLHFLYRVKLIPQSSQKTSLHCTIIPLPLRRRSNLRVCGKGYRFAK